MVTLNLTTKNAEEEKVKKYLEENASEALAMKINNGVKIVKNDKTLISKKSLETFMKYACEEARKQAENATGICIDDPTVFGWAIHYFGEDSIEGTLYNEDGTKHKPIVKPTAPKTVAKPAEVPKPKTPSLFDLIDEKPDPVPIIQEKLKQEIKARYSHPNKNIIVCGMPPAKPETKYSPPDEYGVIEEIEEQESEVDIFNLDDF